MHRKRSDFRLIYFFGIFHRLDRETPFFGIHKFKITVIVHAHIKIGSEYFHVERDLL